MVQPRIFLRFAWVVSVCVHQVWSRRVAQAEEQILASHRHVHETAHLVDKKEQELESMHFPGKTDLGVEKELLVRECVAARAMDWPELHTRLGLRMPENKNTTDSPIDLVIQVFKFKDKIKASQANHKLNWLFKDDGTKAWEAEEEKAATQLLGYQFDWPILRSLEAVNDQRTSARRGHPQVSFCVAVEKEAQEEQEEDGRGGGGSVESLRPSSFLVAAGSPKGVAREARRA
ncbi:unnamed protein product [Prorocentrum cordatum]|uniref:Uncharacterized protein n=1 Tax=Prorocentrum cordatum TaxID=2364126 RepID=A0ABN9SRB1_9DINO|nr:unnamed protein product [Polarella glacialis]